ncbi:MAG: nitroreductase family protein [Halothiobacillaceae bacterium]
MTHSQAAAFLRLMTDRRSVPAAALTDPAPDEATLAQLLQAAASVPDHGGLVPWRLLQIRGAARARLGELFAESMRRRQPDAPAGLIERERDKPMRAPLLLGLICSPTPDHPKVPLWEQQATAATVGGYLLLAAEAAGFGGVWLSGGRCADPWLRAGLGVADHEQLLGFVNLGTPVQRPVPRRRPQPQEILTDWEAPRAGQPASEDRARQQAARAGGE